MSDLQAMADRFEIEALRGEFTDAVMMHDPDRRASLSTEDGVWGIAWSPDGGLLAANRYDTHTFLWDARTGKLLQTLIPSAPPNGVAWSPDGEVLATSSDDGTVQLWDK